MKDKKIGLKIFTGVYFILLLVIMGAFTGYLLFGPDFVSPGDNSNEENSDVWDQTIDDLIEYLDDLGYLDKDDYKLMSEVGTINRIYNGIDIIWWDVDNLSEGTESYKYWKEITENGYIMYGTSVYIPQMNGPFGINATVNFPGNADSLYEDFQKFPVKKKSSVWNKTIDDLIDYLDNLGFLDKNDYKLMSEVGTINRIYNGIDIIWWDVDNLSEGTESYKYWKEITENGYIMYGTSVYIPQMNGPFGINATVNFPGNTEELYKAFSEFA